MNQKLKNWHFIFVLLAVALSVVYIWFRNGEFIGGGEEGIWMFNAQRSINHFLSGWIDIGTGYLTTAYHPRIPILFFLPILQKIFQPFLSQAIVYFLIIFSGMTGMFYLAKEFVGRKNRWVALVIALFYFLNPYSMTQIWNRLIYAGMFSWAFLPIAFYLSLRWVETKKFVYLALFLLSSILFSASFVTISFVFVIWIPILFYIIYKIWERRHDKHDVINISGSALLLGILWILVNVWWIYPFFSASSPSFDSLANLLETNMATLKGVSQYFTTDQIALLRQTYFFSRGDGRDSFWFDFYQSPTAYVLGILGLLAVIAGIYFAYKENIKYKNYLLILFIASWFVIKGTNPPFGETFYKFLFTYIPFIAMFRNPYEKLGLIFLLVYSIFLGLGVYAVALKFKKFKSLFIISFLALLCGYLVWPMWTGKVFTGRVRLKIPEYYQKMNAIINEDPSDSRIAVLPLIKGEAAFYNWGYMGAVPIDSFFDKPVVARPVTSVYPYHMELIDAFRNKDERAVKTFLEELNIGYVVLANDLEKGRNEVQDFDDLSNFLKNQSYLGFAGREGELSLYKVKSAEVGKQFVAVGKEPPELSYRKVGLSEYEITITNAQKGFGLIFKSTYDPSWVAKIDGERLRGHELAYGYANEWRLTRLGSYTIHIYLKLWPWQ